MTEGVEDDARARLERLEQQRESQKTSELEADEAAKSRRFITRIVLWTWVSSLAAYSLLVIFESFVPTNKQASASLLEVIKIAVLPLTTLVLGYYLSRR